MVTTTNCREVFCSSAASFAVRSALVSDDRMLASSTTRPDSTGNFGAAQAGVSRKRKASVAASNRIADTYLAGWVPGWAAAGAGGGAALCAPGNTVGADCAAALAANGVACL